MFFNLAVIPFTVNRNVRTVLIDVQENGGAEIAKAGVTVGAAATVPSPDPVPDEVIRIPLGALVMGVSGLALVAENEYRTSDGEVLEQGSLTAVEERYPASETALEVDVTLPVGAVDSKYNQLTGEVNYVGYGWRQISATTDTSETASLTQSQINDVLSNPDRVISDGEIRYVIDELSNGKSVVLIIIGGTLMAAYADTYTTDPCNQRETIDLEDQEEHYTRNPEDTPDKPFKDRSTVKKLFDNVVDVFVDNRGTRYYVVKVRPGEWTVMVVQLVGEEMAERMLNGWADRRLKTFLTDKKNGRSLFRSYDDAIDAIEEGPRTIDEVDC